MHLTRADTTGNDICLVVSTMAFGFIGNKCRELGLALLNSRFVCHFACDHTGSLQGSHVSRALSRSCILGQNLGDHFTGLAVRSGCGYADEGICL